MVVLVNPSNAANTEITLRDVETAARVMGLQIQVHNASTSREIDAAFATFVRERPDALFVGGDSFFNARRVQLALLAGRHGIPAIHSEREYAEVGGLVSYGSNISDAYRHMGVQAGRILNGAGRPCAVWFGLTRHALAARAALLQSISLDSRVWAYEWSGKALCGLP